MSTVRVNTGKRPGMWRWVEWILFGVVVMALARAVPAQQKRTRSGAIAWEVLQGCTLRTNEFFDGDSFRVTHQNREYNFRVYFVDAPEIDTEYPERVAAQAADFEMAAADIPRAGQMAKEFTRRWLAGRPFTVSTRWMNARGQGAQARFYGVVTVGNQDLAKVLVTFGWARIRGEDVNLPDGTRAGTFINELTKLQTVAQREKRGVWNDRVFKRVAAAARGPTAKPPARTAGGKIDLNTASREELDALPGIGPALVDRIIAGRPYRTVDDLKRVNGVGKKKMEELRPRVTVSRW